MGGGGSAPPAAAAAAPPYVVACLGDPVLDIVAPVPHATLAREGMQPGGCDHVSAPELARLLALPEVAASAEKLPGGSAANVAKGVALLAGGAGDVSFVGMAGADAAAGEYGAGLGAAGVRPLLLRPPAGGGGGDDEGTARCLCLITPDGQRTMRTFLGAATRFTEPAALPPPPPGLALLHCEGYGLYRPAVLGAALRAARAAGARTSLDLASFEVVRSCGAALLELLRARLVDAVFCNEQEAAAVAELLGEEAPAGAAAAAAAAAGAADGECAAALESVPPAAAAALRALRRHCSLAVVSLGAAGCALVLADARGAAPRAAACAARAVEVVDTVGAGDLFTAGVLHAWLRGAAPAAAAAAGCAAGAAAVAVRGATLAPGAAAALRAAVAAALAGGGAHNGDAL